MTKFELYTKLKNEGKFWSYDKTLEYLSDELLIEHCLVWSDVSDIIELFKLFDFEKIKDVWNRLVVPDERYFKLNVYLAFIYFRIKDPYGYIAETAKKYSRYEMFKRMADDPDFNMETDVYCCMYLKKENN